MLHLQYLKLNGEIGFKLTADLILIKVDSNYDKDYHHNTITE